MASGTETTEERLRGQLEELRGLYDRQLIVSRISRRSESTALLVFEIGSAAFAVPADRLLETVRAEGIVAVPCSPQQIAGVLTHRQEIVSVLDLRRLLKIADSADAEPGWVLVLRPTTMQCAILADRVVGVRTVNIDRALLSTEDDGDTPIIARSVTIDGRPVAILDTSSPSFGAAAD